MKTKEFLKKNLMSLILVIGVISVVGVFAGDMIFDGNELNVADDLIVDGDVGIGTDSPDELLDIDDGNGVTGIPRISFNSDRAVVGYEGSVGSDTDYAFLRGGTAKDLRLQTNGNNTRLTILSGGNVGVGTSSPSYPLEVRGHNGSDVTAWFEKNISAEGFMTRTSVYDKSRGSALDLIKDADDLMDGGEINHKAFYGYAGEFEVADYDKPVMEEECVILDEEEICKEVITYPYTVMKEGVLLDAEVDVLRQAVFELKTELCSKDASYKFC